MFTYEMYKRKYTANTASRPRVYEWNSYVVTKARPISLLYFIRQKTNLKNQANKIEKSVFVEVKNKVNNFRKWLRRLIIVMIQ